jgi:GSH-dependent disulfide-bond oxidoreductase
LGEIPESQASSRRNSARAAAQRAVALKDKHKFKTEMEDEARKALFRHLSEKAA